MKFESKILIGLLAIIAISFFIFSNKPGLSNTVQISESDPVLGQPDAPVTFVVFGNYLCGYTKRFFEETFPRLKESYIDTGKVRFVYKQFIQDETWTESEASLCAHDQGKFWPFVSMLFERRESSQDINTSSGEYANELEIARELGLDESAFFDCLTNHAYQIQIQQDFDEGKRLGVSGTPTSFINGLVVAGWLPFEDFESVLSKFSYV